MSLEEENVNNQELQSDQGVIDNNVPVNDDVFNSENPFDALNADEIQQAMQLASEGVTDPQEIIKQIKSGVTPNVPEKAPAASNEVSEPKEEAVQEEVAPQKVNIDVSAYGDFAPYAEELQTKGELSDESIKSITEKYKLPEQVVKDYVEMTKAYSGAYQQLDSIRVQKETQELLEYAGGTDSWNSIKEWANNNLEESEVNKYNELLATGDMSTRKIIIDGLKAKSGMAQVPAAEPKPAKIAGTPAPVHSDNVFKSMSDYDKALASINMNDQRAMQQFFEKTARSVQAGYIKDPNVL